MANRAVVIPSYDQLMNPTLAALHSPMTCASCEALVSASTTPLGQRWPRSGVLAKSN
jgi:hypothetical protein